MNKKLLSISAALLALTAVTLTSCNKDDDDNTTNPSTNQTNQEKIMANWKNVWSATDNNLNGTVEASEQTAATNFQAYRFMSGGVVVDTTNFGGSGDTSRGTWTIYNTNMLALQFSGDADTFKISTLDGSSLVLRTYSSGVDFPFYDGFTKY